MEIQAICTDDMMTNVPRPWIPARERQACITAAVNNNFASSGKMITNPFTLQEQPQPLQLEDLSQLHYKPRPHQSAVVSTGLISSSNDEQQHQLDLSRESIKSVSSLVLSDDLAARIKHQRDEINQFLLAQGGQLRRALAEKWKGHYLAFLGAAEGAVARRLRKKEVEVEKATRHNAELQARAAQLTLEAQIWHAKARAQEAAAASLQAQLQQAMIISRQDKISPEYGSGCGGTGSEAEDAQSAYVDPDRVVVASGPSCRACRRRMAAVVMLPCRHLCLCEECDRVARACPVCFTARESSVEVYLT